MGHARDSRYAPRNDNVACLFAAQPFAWLASTGGDDIAFTLPLRAACVRHDVGAPA